MKSSSYLMEDESLTNGAPGGRPGTQMEHDDQDHAHDNGCRRVIRVDKETHDDTAEDSEGGGVGVEETECWPGKKISHWPLGDSNTILDRSFSSSFQWLMVEASLVRFSQMNITGHYWWKINIGSGNGLVPSGNKPLPKPVLTQIYVAMWRH